MKTHWYKLSAADTLKQLDCGPAGLSTTEAQQRLAKIGPNELVEKGGRTRKDIIVEQLTGVLTILLNYWEPAKEYLPALIRVYDNPRFSGQPSMRRAAQSSV